MKRMVIGLLVMTLAFGASAGSLREIKPDLERAAKAGAAEYTQIRDSLVRGTSTNLLMEAAHSGGAGVAGAAGGPHRAGAQAPGGGYSAASQLRLAPGYRV